MKLQCLEQRPRRLEAQPEKGPLSHQQPDLYRGTASQQRHEGGEYVADDQQTADEVDKDDGGMEREDLISWGMIGLVHAARAWDPERSV